MAHVFISYAHADREYARKLADYLLENGFDVWIDDRIDFGANWEREIFKAIDTCDAIVVIMTPNSYESSWVQRERIHADRRKKQSFPLLLDGEVFPFYGVIQYYDAYEGKLPEQVFLDRLAQVVPRRGPTGRDVTEPPPATAAESTPPAEKSPIPTATTDLRKTANAPKRWPILVVLTTILALIALILVANTFLDRFVVPANSTSTPFGGGHGQIAFTSDQDGNNEIYVANIDGTGFLNLTNNPADDAGPVWSPDGQRIAFGSDRGGNYDIYLMNADGTDVSNLTNNSATDEWPTWSPDGQQMAFGSYREGNWDIYVMDLNGENLRRLSSNTANDRFAHWSPDGQHIVFQSDRDGNWEIYTMKPDGSDITRITNNDVYDQAFSWSPDSRRIAFISQRDVYYEIYTMNLDGTDIRRLTNNTAYDVTPVWSPDGQQIMFISDRDGSKEIYMMNIDGSNVRRITHNQTNETVPAWRP